MDCKEFQKLPIDEQRRILADEAKEFAERQLPADWEVKLEAYRDAEISRLQGELAEAKTKLATEINNGLVRCAMTYNDGHKDGFQASEQARQDAVRELEQEKEDNDTLKQTLERTQSRLTKAEEALKRISEFDCTCPYYMGHDCECPSCRASAVLAALQPVQEGEKK